MSYSLQNKRKLEQQGLYGKGGKFPAPYFPKSTFIQAVEDRRLPPSVQSLDDWRMTEEKFDLYRQALEEFAAEAGPYGVSGGFEHSYAANKPQLKALKADTLQPGMAGSYAMPADQYYPYKGGNPGWMQKADEADMQRTLKENPLMSNFMPMLSVKDHAADRWKTMGNRNVQGASDAGANTINTGEDGVTGEDEAAIFYARLAELQNQYKEQLNKAATPQQLRDLYNVLLHLEPYGDIPIPDSLVGKLDFSTQWIIDLCEEIEEKEAAHVASVLGRYENPVTAMDQAFAFDLEWLWSPQDVQQIIQSGKYDDYFSAMSEGFPEYEAFDQAKASLDFADMMLLSGQHAYKNWERDQWPQWLKDIAGKDAAVNWLYTFAKQDLLSQRKSLRYGHNIPFAETVRSDYQKWLESVYAQYAANGQTAIPAAVQADINVRREEALRTIQEEVSVWQAAYDELWADHDYVYIYGSGEQVEEWEFRYDLVTYRLASANAALLFFAPDFEQQVAVGRADQNNDVVYAEDKKREIQADYSSNAVPLHELKSIPYLAHAMTQHEKDVYSYYLATEGKKTADAYFEDICNAVEHRAAAFQKAEDEKKNPTWGLIESIPGMPFARMEALLVAGIGVLTGDDITEDDPRFGNLRRFEQYRENFRQAITKDCTPEQAQAVNMLFEMGISMADMAAALVFGSGVKGMTLIMASSAGGSTVYETLEKGGDIRDAFARGMASMAVSYIAGKLGTGERLASAFTNPEKIGTLWSAFAKSFISEGVEELPGWVVDKLTDEMLLGVQSSYNMAVRTYYNEGKSFEEAEELAAMDATTGLLMQMLSSSFSGSLSTSVAYMAGSAKVKSRAKALQSEAPNMNADLAGYVANAEVGADPGSGGLAAWFKNLYTKAMPKTASAEGMDSAGGLASGGEIFAEVEGGSTQGQVVDVGADAGMHGQENGTAENALSAVGSTAGYDTGRFEGPALPAQGVTADGTQVALTGIQGVGKNAAVRTEDGRVIPIGEVGFGDFETKAMYEIAAGFPDSATANRFLQIYHESGWHPADFLQLYLDVYMTQRNGVGAQGINDNTYLQLPFSLNDVVPYGALHLSGESMDAFNTLRAQYGVPPLMAENGAYYDDLLAQTSESDIMESSDAQEEAGSEAGDTYDPGRQTAEGTGKLITEIKYTPSSGVALKGTPGKTTTIVGSYRMDMKHILRELGDVKTTGIGPNHGGFNVLNTPNECYKNERQFWVEYNRRWLEAAIKRGDDIVVATKPENEYLYIKNTDTGKVELTGFGREYFYLLGHGYVYDSATNMMIRK